MQGFLDIQIFVPVRSISHFEPFSFLVLYCGEEITTKHNWNGIGWEDKEMKKVSNYYFYHQWKIVVRNLERNIDTCSFSGAEETN